MKNLRRYLAHLEQPAPELGVPIAASGTEDDETVTGLVWNTSGLLLVSARGPDNGELRELKTLSEVTYDATEGRLRVGDTPYRVDPKHSDEVRLMLRRAALREEGRPERSFSRKARHVERLTLPAKIWLSSTLDEGEDVLAWLEGDSEKLTAERDGASLHFLLTDRRAALAISTPAGDGELLPLPEEPLAVEAPEGWLPLGRRKIAAGEHTWYATHGNGSRYREIGPLVGLALPERLLELARWNWKKGERAVAADLLRSAIDAGEPHAALLANLRFPKAAETWPDLDSALTQLVGTVEDSVRLARLCERWELDLEQRNLLLHGALSLEDLPRGWAVPLYRAIHDLALEREKDASRKTEWSFGFADYLIESGLYGEATGLLEAWLAAQASGDVRAILPPEPGTELPESVKLRIQALESLERAHVLESGSNGELLPRLALVQPLDTAYLAPLAARAEGRTRRSLDALLALFEPGGLGGGHEPDEPDDEVTLQVLDAELIDGTLQHEVAREGSVWGRLQSILAEADVPDSGALRSYCQRLPQDSPIYRSASDASLVLGTPVPEIFISRGEQAAGLRAFESKPPFLLIGSEHLDPESPMHLRPAEMGFGVASELAHLRFKHTRATAAEVREGALAKSLAALGFAVSLVPLASAAGKLAAGGEVASRLVKLFKNVPDAAFEKVSEGAGFFQGLVSKLRGDPSDDASRDDLSKGNDDIVEAHRVMQLTADRAGLVLGGDLRSAIRFMVLSCPAYHAEMRLLERLGLAGVLDRRQESGSLLYEDLVLRIGNLLAFYLSQDYSVLREAAGFGPRS